MAKNSEKIKIMADLLKQGATLTEYTCPACSSPIFKLRRGELWCASCKKRVIIVKEGEPEPEAQETPVLSRLEITIMNKIQQIQTQLAEEADPEKMTALGVTLSTLLENLEKIRNIKK